LHSVIIAAVIVVVVIVVIVAAGSKAPFIAVAGTLLILVAAVQRSLVASLLVALMDRGRPVFIVGLVTVAISDGRGLTNP
jgi:hypothetical protein